jgi:hypothetical protein
MTTPARGRRRYHDHGQVGNFGEVHDVPVNLQSQYLFSLRVYGIKHAAESCGDQVAQGDKPPFSGISGSPHKHHRTGVEDTVDFRYGFTAVKTQFVLLFRCPPIRRAYGFMQRRKACAEAVAKHIPHANRNIGASVWRVKGFSEKGLHRNPREKRHDPIRSDYRLSRNQDLLPGGVSVRAAGRTRKPNAF